MNIESKEKDINQTAESHEMGCTDCYSRGGMVTLCPNNPKHPKFTSGELSKEAQGVPKYSKGGIVKDTDSGSPTMNKAAHANGEIPKDATKRESDKLDDESLRYENSRPASLGESKNSPIGTTQQYDGMPPVENEEEIMSSLSDKAMRKRMAKGGSVERNDSVLDPMSDALPDDMRFISTDTNDFKDRDDVLDPEHDAGAVDEMEDQSLSGMAMKKRSKR